MYTLFDLFSSGKCIGCDKIIKSYYNCCCFEKNNILYYYPNVSFHTIRSRTIFTKSVFYDKKDLVFLICKNNKFYYEFSAYEAGECLFEFPEKEFISNTEFLLYFNDVTTKTYNNLIFI